MEALWRASIDSIFEAIMHTRNEQRLLFGLLPAENDVYQLKKIIEVNVGPLHLSPLPKTFKRLLRDLKAGDE
jgi:hypothetical protein